MALRLRTVTGKVADAKDVPVTNAQVSFTLTKPIGYAEDFVVVDELVYTTTDATTGIFSIDLWCDEDSLIPIDYTVNFPIVNGGTADPAHTATISLMYEDGSDKDIGELIGESTPPPSSVSDETWAELIDSRIGNGDISTQTGTTYTIQDTDAGKTIRTNNGSAVTITVPNALPIGFQCLVLQDGAGQVSFTSSDATIRNRQSHDKIAGQYGVAAILKVADAEFRLQGDTAA